MIPKIDKAVEIWRIGGGMRDLKISQIEYQNLPIPFKFNHGPGGNVTKRWLGEILVLWPEPCEGLQG